MAQAYITVYEKTYVWHDYRNRTKTKKPPEAIYDEPPKADIWLETVTAGNKTFGNSPDDVLKKFVAKLYRRRNWSTYQVCYCSKEIKKVEGVEDVQMADNELIEYGKRLYSEPTQKIMKPLPTARKLYGYIRPKNMYFGISEYQGTVGKEGYGILLKHYKPGNR